MILAICDFIYIGLLLSSVTYIQLLLSYPSPHRLLSPNARGKALPSHHEPSLDFLVHARVDEVQDIRGMRQTVLMPKTDKTPSLLFIYKSRKYTRDHNGTPTSQQFITPQERTKYYYVRSSEQMNSQIIADPISARGMDGC